MTIKRKLGLAGILLSAAMAFGVPSFARAETEKNSKTDITESKSKPEILASFEYPSHREGYKGKIFTYDLWSDGKISQADKESVEFSNRWYYDIDGDGKFGEAEKQFLKKGKLVYMHENFNRIANDEVRKAFGSLINEKEDKEILNHLEIELEKEKYSEKLKESEELNNQYESIEKGEYSPKAKENEKLKIQEKIIIEHAPLAEPARESAKKESPLGFIAGGKVSFPKFLEGRGLYGAELGVKLGRVGIVGNISGAQSKNIQNTEEKLKCDVYFKGTEDIKNFLSAGIAVEYHQPITDRLSAVVGVGGNLENYTRQGTATLVERTAYGDDVINSNTDSFSEKDFTGKIYAGPSVKITDWLRLNANIGYETDFNKKNLDNKGFYASLRTIISPQKRNQEKKNSKINYLNR